MCGLIAFNAKDTVTPENLAAVRLGLEHMRFRGPDGEGVWQDAAMLLGHRRLAIIDLDPRAAQPMRSPCGRYQLVFNGEIYNFRELKQALLAEGVHFATESDSEVILALYAKHGEAMLPLLRGMFALVIWDSHESRGFAARDPYGIKPLYYSATEHGLWFASQVKALLATGKISEAACTQGQAGFWLLGSVPEPYTWIEAIKALPAGHCVHFSRGALHAEPACWWNVGVDFLASEPTEKLVPSALQAAVREAVLDSVRAHLVADVPVAVFLSGGIDSGALAGLMVEAGARDLHGITVAFREFEGRADDEAPVAAQVAERYGIKHHVRWVSRQEFDEDLPHILDAMDQPSIDGINTWFASKAVAELGLKVVVSGLGGDELFQGYGSFSRIPKLQRAVLAFSQIPGLPLAMRLLCGLVAKYQGNARYAHIPNYARSLPGAWLLSRGLFAESELPGLMPGQLQALKPLAWIETAAVPLSDNPRLAVSQLESAFYMRNQLLRDSDWASMAHSIELRTPLVDAHLLRRLQPLLAQFENYPGKALLAGTVQPSLPLLVTERAKTGFGVPMSAWLGSGNLDERGQQSRSWAKRVAAANSPKGTA